MKTQWGVKGCAQFLFESVLKPTAVLWLEFICPHNRKPGLTQILDRLPQVDLTNEICKCESIFEVPFQYSVFEDPFLLFLASPVNIISLYKLIRKLPSTPASFRTLLDEKSSDIVFWLKTYPRHLLTSVTNYRPLVFPHQKFSLEKTDEFDRRWRSIENLSESLGKDPFDLVRFQKDIDSDFFEYALTAATLRLSEIAEAFETYLLYQLHISAANTWISICDAYEQFVLAPLFTQLSETSRTNQLETTFANARVWIKSIPNRKFLFLIILDSFIPPPFKPCGPGLMDFEKRWMTLIKSKTNMIDGFQLNTSQSAAAIFWEAVERLRNIDYEELPFQFLSLIQAMRLLYHVDHNEEAVKGWIRFAVIMAADVQKLIGLFFMLNVWAMACESFRQVCSEEEHRLWVVFQQVILEFILENETISSNFFALQKLLMDL
jgi:hypothetical protein